MELDEFKLMEIDEHGIVTYTPWDNDVRCGDAEEVLQIFACEHLNFCGCGLPTDALVFYITQLKSVISDECIDYTHCYGAVDFFKLVGVSIGVLTPDIKLTEKGTAVVSIFDALMPHINLAEQGYESPTPHTEPYTRLSRPVPLENDVFREQLISLWLNQFSGMDVVTAENIKRSNVNVTKAMYHLLELSLYLCVKHGMSIETHFNTVYKLGEELFSVSDGAFYWFFYMTDNLLNWEEHGGASPGWLTTKGEEGLNSLVKLFCKLELTTVLTHLTINHPDCNIGAESTRVIGGGNYSVLVHVINHWGLGVNKQEEI